MQDLGEATGRASTQAVTTKDQLISQGLEKMPRLGENASAESADSADFCNFPSQIRYVLVSSCTRMFGKLQYGLGVPK